MQRSLLRWKMSAFYLIMLHCLTSSQVKGQINYTFTSTTGTYTQISGGTMIVDDNTNDELSSTANIGFSFVYGCRTYTQFKASSNGWMSLGTSASSSMATNNLTTTSSGPIIAPLWDDLRTGSAGVVYRTTGTAPNRVLTVEWSAVRWNRSASGSVISFQAKLYETANVIEFIYYQNSNAVNSGSASIGLSGGGSNTDFYSVSGINGTATAIYGTETNNQNQKPGYGRIYRWTPGYGYTSAATTQPVTSSISKCNNSQQLIAGVQVVVQECSSPLNTLTGFKINMLGTTNISDVSAIHIYYTGTTSGYSAIQEFGTGTITPAGGTITVTGSQLLATGTNYFWIAYDVNSSATSGNVLDAQCTEITIDGIARTLSVFNPSGSRTIANCTAAPGGITEASFWVKANAGASSTNNTKISTWNDQSGNSRHATNSDADNQPTYYDNATKNMNFNPIVEFDEAGQDKVYADFMDISSNGVLAPGNNPYEVYAVIVPGANNLTTPGKFLFAGEAGTNNFNAFDVRSNYSINDSWNINDLIVANTWAVDSLCMLTFDYNYTRRQAFKAGSSIGIRTSSQQRTSANLNNALGCQRTAELEYYDGGIAEIISYANITHSTATREKVQSYLAIKYGVTLSHNYKSSIGTIVWNRSLNANYNNNIIGIARDDMGALLQKQSKSTAGSPDILTLYIGPSKEVNQAANTGSFTAGDGSFFMAGSNNDAPLDSWPSSTEKPAGICCRILREWLVQKTNFTNVDLKLEFNFNAVTTGYLPLNAADLRLLVDADGNFTNATILGSPAITINAAAGVATITVPASLLSNNSYFTLASVSTNTILPLELKAFTGLCKDQAVQLRWTTASPVQNDFLIERSTDKVNFSPVGTVKSNTTGNYAWTDQSPLPGTLYYRLKTTKDNGAGLYSAIIGVNGCNTTTIQLSTNPATNASTLMLQLSQNSQTEISLYDLLGRRFEAPGLTGKRSLEKGVHYIPVHIPVVATGMYLLHVNLNGERHVYRIVKK